MFWIIFDPAYSLQVVSWKEKMQLLRDEEMRVEEETRKMSRLVGRKIKKRGNSPFTIQNKILDLSPLNY